MQAIIRHMCGFHVNISLQMRVAVVLSIRTIDLSFLQNQKI